MNGKLFIRRYLIEARAAAVMTLLENEQFLIELNKLYLKSRTSTGAPVTVTMKRYDGRTKPKPREGSASSVAFNADYKCLFRAKFANMKISTAVSPKDVNKFQLAYANVLKANIDNLKKRDKKSQKEKKGSAIKRSAAQ